MKRSSSWFAVLPSLVIPVCVGMILYLGLNLLIEHEYIANETMLRYLTGHPVSKVTVGMFFIGLASIALIANNVFEQFNCEKSITLSKEQRAESENDTVEPVVSSVSNHSNPGEQAVELAARLTDLPKLVHTHYLFQRLKNALHSVYRNDSTENVEDELKHLADLDLDQQQQRYSLVRILIWATPMLGFLGTVLGISQALGGINVGPENNFQTMMDGLRGSLYVAFDTTALALTLSMLLMFGQFLVDRFESQLLLLVDHRAQSEISRHLSVVKETKQGSIATEIRQSTEQQTKIWQKTIQSAEKAWASSLTQANMRVQDNMSIALDDNVANLAHYLGEAIEKADTAMAHRWQQWQVTLSDNARQLANQQTSLSEQTELLHDLLAQAKNLSTEQPAQAQKVQEQVQAQIQIQNGSNLDLTPTIPQLENIEPTNIEPANIEPETPKVDADVHSQIVKFKPVEKDGLTESVSIESVTTEGSLLNLKYRKTRTPEVVAKVNEDSTDEKELVGSKPVEDSSVNFQAYLDGLLVQAKQAKLKGRNQQTEVILPFQFSGEPASQAGKSGFGSKEQPAQSADQSKKVA